MAILILIGKNEADRQHHDWFIQDFLSHLREVGNELDVRVYPEVGDPTDIEFAIVWSYPRGVLSQFPNLRCIAAASAGVDHVLGDPTLPSGVPIVRITDPTMAMDITQYVVAAVLHRIKRLDFWEAKQRAQVWNRQPPFYLRHQTIGIMGLGFLGQHAALALQNLGLNVVGWSQSAKNLKGIETFAGNDQLPSFLSGTNILVCMLPLTPATEDILNAAHFAYLPKGAYLINLGRGEHLVEADLLASLKTEHLSGACLDVFRKEPLPEAHPFWTHPLISVTPHVASVTNPATALPQILENYKRLKAELPLLNEVDIERGY
jgi:glyoxylate/hydroxypyruvate reductase A